MQARFAVRHTRRPSAALLAVTLVSAAVLVQPTREARAQALNLGPEPVPRLTVLYLKDRATRIEEQLKQLEADRATAPALMASIRIHVRNVALHLLRSAIAEPGNDSNAAALYGLTLADGLPELDELAAHLPAVEAAIKDPATPNSRVVTSNLAMERLRAMVEKNPSATPAVHLADAPSVRQFLVRQLSALALLSAAAEQKPSTGVWLVHPAAGKWSTAPPRDVKALVTRWETLIGGKRADPLSELAAAFKASDGQADLRARAAEPLAAFDRALGVLEVLAASSWVTPQARTTIERAVVDAVKESVDPFEHRAAHKKLSLLASLAPIMQHINTLRSRKVETAPLETLFVAAINRGELEKSRLSEAEGLDWLRRATIALRSTTPEGDRAPQQPDLRAAYLRAEQDWQKRQRDILAVARDVTLRAAAANDPAALLSITSAERRARDLKCITQLPDDIDLTVKLQAKPAGAVYRRMKDAAVNSIDAMRETASAELSEFHRQVGLFREFPGETDLDQEAKSGGASSWPSIGKRASALSAHLDSQRREWATAWASGRNPSAAGRPMYTQRDAMRSLRDLELMRADPAGAATLVNRWPGLAVDKTALQKEITAALAASEAMVTRLIDAGSGDLTERWLDDYAPPAPIRAIAAVHYAMANSSVTSKGAPAVLAELFEPPPGDAYLRDQLDDAALFSRLTNEWLYQRGRGSSEPSRAALNKAALRLIAATDE